MAAPSDTTAQFDTETGPFVIKHHTAEVARANFVFWTGKWSWSGLKLETKVSGPFDYEFSGMNKENGFGTYWIVFREAQ